MSGAPAALAVAAFVAGAAISLTTSGVLVRRLEGIGAQLHLSEAALGMVAALAADAPEVTSAVSAVAQHKQGVGAGVVIGSNVFNLAALLGLGALVAGRIFLHRDVVLLAGGVALWTGAACVLAVVGALPAGAALAMGLIGVAAYAAVLSLDAAGLRRLGVPAAWASWLRRAAVEEEVELAEPSPPRSANGADIVVAVVALVVVVAASVMMELAATTLGDRWSVPEIVVGGVVLAAVTSLPNSVSAVYLARRGRATATLTTALNSNMLNVVIGLLLPGALLGLGRPSGQTTFVAVWYVGLTVVALLYAWSGRGLRRLTGGLLVVGYGGFLAVVLASGHGAAPTAAVLAPAAAVTGALMLLPAVRR